MTDTGISVTLKAGRDYDAPWIVVHGDTTEDVITHLAALEHHDMLPRVKRLGKIFSQTPADTAEAVANVKTAMPGSEVIGQELPASMTSHKCGTCGASATLRKGTYRKGPKQGQPYQGYFCTANQMHKPVLI